MAAESKWWTQNLKLFRLICTENEVYTVAFKAGMVPIDSVEDSDQKEGRLPADLALTLGKIRKFSSEK